MSPEKAMTIEDAQKMADDDGKIEAEEPKGLIGYVSVPIGRWMFNIPYS